MAWRGGERWAELELSGNPFAVVVMAHLEALRTRNDPAGRKLAKLAKAGLALLPEVEQVQDEALLRRIPEAIRRGADLEAVRGLWEG